MLGVRHRRSRDQATEEYTFSPYSRSLLANRNADADYPGTKKHKQYNNSYTGPRQQDTRQNMQTTLGPLTKKENSHREETKR